MLQLNNDFITIERARESLPLGLGIASEHWQRFVNFVLNADLLEVFCIEFISQIPTASGNDWELIFEGGEYTVLNTQRYCPSLKYAMILLAYSRYLLEGDVVNTTHGVVRKKTEFSEPLPMEDRKMLAERYKRQGINILREIDKCMIEMNFKPYKVCYTCDDNGGSHGYFSKILK